MNSSGEQMPPNPPNLTQALTDWRNGDQDAGNRLFAAAYQELRRLAAWYLQKERPGHTLQATALVNELYLKLFGGEPVAWQNRAHFFAVAAQQIRRLLVDHARAGLAEKRGGSRVKLSLTEVKGLAAPDERALLDLDDALRHLEALDPRAARIVELRYFAGASEQETAEVAGISVATVKRDWGFARAWLISQLKPEN
ncbi:MAG TPA: sigma-70 family RNA polymerase sigma factor [Bryobacteraceae bacterium]|nr:sigma-70 family RNA polymerase sigma factor [Bryobacteraceae bacterium]